MLNTHSFHTVKKELKTQQNTNTIINNRKKEEKKNFALTSLYNIFASLTPKKEFKFSFSQ